MYYSVCAASTNHLRTEFWYRMIFHPFWNSDFIKFSIVSNIPVTLMSGKKHWRPAIHKRWFMYDHLICSHRLRGREVHNNKIWLDVCLGKKFFVGKAYPQVRVICSDINIEILFLAKPCAFWQIFLKCKFS